MKQFATRLVMLGLLAGLALPMAQARTVYRYRTYRHTYRQSYRQPYYRTHSVRFGTIAHGGAWGRIVRKPTLTNRNIRVRFDNGENPVLEIPKAARVTVDGRPSSVHDLHNGQRVHVWAARGKRGEAMQAWRINAY